MSAGPSPVLLNNLSFGGNANGERPFLEQFRKAKHQPKTEAIRAALTSTQWSRRKVATLLRIDYRALRYKMKQLGIEKQAGALPPGEEEL